MANAKCTGVRGIQRIQSYPIKSGSTFNPGDFLVWTSTGADSPPAVGNNYALSSLVLGRAVHGSTIPDGSGGTYTHVDVIVAEPGTQFEMPLYSSTLANTVAKVSYLNGAGYELRNATGGIPMVDLTATTNKAVRVVDFNSEDIPTYPNAVTDGPVQYARVFVEFLGAACSATGAR